MGRNLFPSSVRHRALVVIALVVATGAAAGQVPDGGNDGLPKGLEPYLEARVLEASGQYRPFIAMLRRQ